MRIVLLAILWSFSAFSSSVTNYYEFKSKKYNRCIKINNTNLDLLACDGKDKWEIGYDLTSGQVVIKNGIKNWYVSKEEKGFWSWLLGLFKTSRLAKNGTPTIIIHQHNPSDFILDKALSDKTENVSILHDVEEKCLDVLEEKNEFILILNKCSEELSQKWDITRLKELPDE